jgi:hypothetical protein
MSHHCLVIKCVQTVIMGEEVGLAKVRLVMRMRRGSWLTASSSPPHIANLNIRHDSITQCKKLESMILE